MLASKEERKARTLFETDNLLGVFDGHRMGAFRFKESSDGSALNNNSEMASPPWTSVRKLEQASLRLEGDSADDAENLTGSGLSLNVSEKDNSLDLNLALEVAPYFRVSEKRATTIIEDVKKSVALWRTFAEKHGDFKKRKRDNGHGIQSFLTQPAK